jgi:transcriptional regulator with XRE-family HTH domain
LHFVYQLQTLPTSATVGERIRYYRNKKGLRIVDLAARAGISRDALMGYEADETDPPLECVIKIADILNIMPDKLFDAYYAFLAYPYSLKIYEKRKGLALTQKSFGTLLGVGRRTVEKWESGKHLVTRKVYLNLIKNGLI